MGATLALAREHGLSAYDAAYLELAMRDSMNNLATQINGVIATTNQDRQETNSRLASISAQVAAIAKHLGVI